MKNDWSRRWAFMRIALGVDAILGLGLFTITPELATQIAGPMSLIVASVTSLAVAYMGTATWDDKRNGD